MSDLNPDADEIDNETYMLVQHQLTLLAGIMRALPLRAFVDRINTAESTAPLFNPSLYMRAEGKLTWIKRLAVAALKFQQALPTKEELEQAVRKQRAVEKMQGGDF